MTDSTDGRPARFKPLSLPVACFVLFAIVLAAWAIVGVMAFRRQGAIGLQATAIAAFTCWFSATVALVLAGILRDTPHAVSGILGGTLIRLMLPLAVAAGCQASNSVFAKAGLFGYLVLFFLLTLTVETLLLVWLLQPGMKLPATKRLSSKAV